MFLGTLFLANLILYSIIRWKGLIQPDPIPDENQGCIPQFNTVAKNPKVVKEIVFITLFFFDATILNICHWMIIQVPQPFDHSLAILLIGTTCLGFITPVVIWASNKKLQTHTMREFWDEAPLWMINLKNLYFQEPVQEPQNCIRPQIQNDQPVLQCASEEAMCQELKTISKEIEERVNPDDSQTRFSEKMDSIAQGNPRKFLSQDPKKLDGKSETSYIKEKSLIEALKSLEKDPELDQSIDSDNATLRTSKVVCMDPNDQESKQRIVGDVIVENQESFRDKY